MKNLDIRVLVSEKKLRFTEIAAQMGISANWLSTLMRYELTDRNRARILTAIEVLTRERDRDGE